MLKRSIADRKIAALAAGRDLYLGMRMIRQVTDGPHINHPTYFLQSSFFPGDREMFFTSYRTGDAQLFEISLDSGETRQLTRGAPIHPYSAALHPDGASLVVTRVAPGRGTVGRRSRHSRGAAYLRPARRATRRMLDRPPMESGSPPPSRDKPVARPNAA